MRLTSTRRRQSASVVSTTAPATAMPALRNSRSSGPSATTRSASACTASGVGDVDLVRRAGTAGRVDLGGDPGGPVGVAVDDVHRRAAPGALERERPADAGGRTGDDDGAAAQVVDARVRAALQAVGGDGGQPGRGEGGQQAQARHLGSLAA